MTPTEKKISKTALLLIGVITIISLLLSLLEIVTFNIALKTISITFIVIGLVGFLVNEVHNTKDHNRN